MFSAWVFAPQHSDLLIGNILPTIMRNQIVNFFDLVLSDFLRVEIRRLCIFPWRTASCISWSFYTPSYTPSWLCLWQKDLPSWELNCVTIFLDCFNISIAYVLKMVTCFSILIYFFFLIILNCFESLEICIQFSNQIKPWDSNIPKT